MARLGIFCLPLPSHLNLFLSLAEVLTLQGHQVKFFGIPEVDARVRQAGFDFVHVEPTSVPSGTIHSLVQAMGDAVGLTALRLQIAFDRLRSEAILTAGPKAVRHAALDLLIIDQAEAAGGSVAEYLQLPWVSVASGLCLNAEPRVPPFFTSWDYVPTPAGMLRNQAAYQISRVFTRPVQSVINRFRKQWRLRPFSRLDQTFSPYAQICQQIQEFDFPRRHLPKQFHFVGPLGGTSEKKVEFPWSELNGKPLVYASLGTLLNRHGIIYEKIIEACAPLDVQLVLSLGGAGDPDRYSDLPGTALVVRYAPQRELLKLAHLTITHAGLNTTLESLSEGVPLVAIPITFEQPAIAARIRWTATGDFITPGKLTVSRLRDTVVRVMDVPSYKAAALGMKELLGKTDGRQRAVDIIASVLQSSSA